MIQIPLKTKINHKDTLKNMQIEISAPRKEWEFLRQEQVGKLFLIINKVEFSIYRFLTSRAKKTKKTASTGRVRGRTVH